MSKPERKLFQYSIYPFFEDNGRAKLRAVIFYGSGGIQHTLPRDTKAQVEEDVQETRKMLGKKYRNVCEGI